MKKVRKKRVTAEDWLKVHDALHTAIEVAQNLEGGGMVLDSLLKLQKNIKQVTPNL